MSDLFNSPVLLIEQPSKELNYQITDQQGTALAYASQVAGNRPKTGFAAFAATLAAEQDRSRVVVQVARPDGTPLFFVDRAAATPGIKPPCAVVAPDGQLIGSVQYENAEVARNRLASRGTNQHLYQLLDAEQRPLCRIEWEPMRLVGRSSEETHWEGGRYASFIDMNRTQIAYLDISASGVKTDRFALQLGFQFPEPLRTLVIAAPLSMDLISPDRF
jgi:hypothetical protein